MGERPVLLIADDNEDVVMLLKMYLRPLECEILVAKDGEEALAIAQSRLPDVVLLDVMMPKRSGWEVCQALKGVQRTSGIAVVLVTGRGEVKDRLTGLQVGAEEYLYDKATGLPTVPVVADRVKEVLIEQGEIGVVYVDIEQFEAIEAEYGW